MSLVMRSATTASSISTLGGLVAIVLWSSTIALARSLSEQLGSLTAGACVYVVGGVVALLTAGTSGRTRLGSLSARYLWGCGFLFVLYTVLLYVAVGAAASRTQALEIGVVNYLWPALTILFSVPLLRQRAGPLLLIGTVLAVTGVFLVMTQGADFSWSTFAEHLRSNPLPYWLALFAAIAWALYSNLARRWSKENSGGAAGWFIAASGIVLLGSRFLFPETSTWSARTILEGVVLGTITALAYVLWDNAMRRGNLVLVAACSYLTPLLSTAVSGVYLQVEVTRRFWMGCLVLVAGSVISWRSVVEEGSHAMTAAPLEKSGNL
jgi:drug/metabolite transporter (DMT)-like permease